MEAFLRARQGPHYGRSLEGAIAAARQAPIWEAARGWLEAAAAHIDTKNEFGYSPASIAVEKGRADISALFAK